MNDTPTNRPWQQQAIPWDRATSPRPIITADVEAAAPQPEKRQREPWTPRRKRRVALWVVGVLLVLVAVVMVRRATLPPPQQRYVAVCVDAATWVRVPDTSGCQATVATHWLYVRHGGLVPAVGQPASLSVDVSLTAPTGPHTVSRGFGEAGGRAG